MSNDEFQDFSYASHWEKLAGEIEQVLRRWLWTKEGTLTQEQSQIELKQKLHFRKEPYLLSLHLPGDQCRLPSLTAELPEVAEPSPVSSVNSDTAEEEEFEFLPQEETTPSVHHSNLDFTGEVFLKPSEQFDDTLLNLQRWFGVRRFVLLQSGNQSGRILDTQEASTVLSAAAVALAEFPRCIPLFIPIQDSYRDAYKGVGVLQGRSVFFDVDSSHLTLRPEHLRSVLGQLQVFSRQLRVYSPGGAQLCEDVACGIHSQVEDYEIGVSSCVTYALHDPTKRMGSDGEEEVDDGWDDGCVWQPWAAQKDPIASLEVDLIWEDVELSAEDPTPTLSAMNASSWKIHALQEKRSASISWSIFAKKSSFERKHLKFPLENIENSRSCFARLLTLLQGVHLAQEAHCIGDLDSEEWWEAIGTHIPTIPPDNLIEDSIHDLLGDDYCGLNASVMTQHVHYQDPVVCTSVVEENGSRCSLGRFCGFHSLIGRFGLHCVVYRNARAVGLLWVYFVQAIRVHFWEKLHLIPIHLNAEIEDNQQPESPDLNACLLHQKLQMLNVCIYRLTKKRRTKLTEISPPEAPEVDPSGARGVAGILPGAYLEDRPEIPVNIPVTQLLPVHTSDTLAEEASVLSALHDSPQDRERASREQAKVLISDMAAFKAANPQSQLEDFVKWHSPKDWVASESGQGGYLSQRMSHENDNKWKKLWDEIQPCPTSEQLPLFDPALAGERALYFLETIEPHKLFWQLFQVAFVSCFGLLERSPAAHSHPEIQTRLKELYAQLKDGLDGLENSPDGAFPLLQSFRTAEMCVVLAESLSRHLPDCEATIKLLLEQILHSEKQEDSPEDLEEQSSTEIQEISVPSSDRESVLKLLLKEEKTEQETEGQKRVLSGQALQHEWIVKCGRKEQTQGEEVLNHRLYFKDASHEVRLGTVLISEM